MIFFLVEWLQTWGLKGNFWLSSSTRMLLATLTALLMTIGLGPMLVRLLQRLKIGQVIRQEECPPLGRLHAKKEGVPTMGGVLILFGMLLSLLLWMDWRSSFTLILLFVTLSIGFIGGLDDFLKLYFKKSKGLPGRWKFSGQLLVAGCVGLYLLWPDLQQLFHQEHWFAPLQAKLGSRLLETQELFGRIYLPFIKTPVLIVQGFGILFIFFWILLVITGSSNAVNLTDGLDGLAAGTILPVALTFALFAFLSNHAGLASYHHLLYIEGSSEIAVYLMAMAGACLGFLWYNAHPAQLFMGDVGSLPLGALLGVSALLLRREFLLLLVGGIFVAEACSVIIQVLSFRLRHGKRVFLCSPLHHHFEYKGMAESKIVIRFWIIGFFLALIGLCSLKLLG